jgi:hypothetical protein
MWAAAQESKRMGMSFIAPEHIFLAVLTAGGEDSRRLFARLGLDTERLQTEALRRLKGEAESEGAAATAAKKKAVAVRFTLPRLLLLLILASSPAFCCCSLCWCCCSCVTCTAPAVASPATLWC